MSAAAGTSTELVYVYLLNEDAHVWRPVPADALGGDRYRLSSEPAPDDEEREHAPGSVVIAKPRELSGGVCLVAEGQAERRLELSVPRRVPQAARA